VLLLLPSQAMAEQDWTHFKVAQKHLVGQGFMMVVELMTWHVLEDPKSPAPVEGYMVSFVVFYEQGFDVSLH
jgi:hypothetical protein